MKISVCVPVYNTEKYVGRCIESVRSQSFINWELFLIADDSTDGSPEILDKYGNQYSKIRVIHQDNSGPGIARNRGVENAQGNYIVFIDSDDVIKTDYFEKLLFETADVVFVDIDQVDMDFNGIRKEYLSDYHTLSKDDFIREQMTGKISWGRMAVKTEI